MTDTHRAEVCKMNDKEKCQMEGARYMQNLRYVWMRRKYINVFANGMTGQQPRNQPPAKCFVNCWRWTVSACKSTYRIIRGLQIVDWVIGRREAIQGIAKWGWETLRDILPNLSC